MKKRDIVELWTYGTYDELNDTDFGISFEVPKSWLREYVVKEWKYPSLKAFLEDYTWDTTLQTYLDGLAAGVVKNVKCGRFGHVIHP